MSTPSPFAKELAEKVRAAVDDHVIDSALAELIDRELEQVVGALRGMVDYYAGPNIFADKAIDDKARLTLRRFEKE